MAYYSSKGPSQPRSKTRPAPRRQVAHARAPRAQGAMEAVDAVVAKAKPDFKARMAVKLAVAGAFHTEFMAPAVGELAKVLDTVEARRRRDSRTSSPRSRDGPAPTIGRHVSRCGRCHVSRCAGVDATYPGHLERRRRRALRPGRHQVDPHKAGHPRISSGHACHLAGAAVAMTPTSWLSRTAGDGAGPVGDNHDSARRVGL